MQEWWVSHTRGCVRYARQNPRGQSKYTPMPDTGALLVDNTGRAYFRFLFRSTGRLCELYFWGPTQKSWWNINLSRFVRPLYGRIYWITQPYIATAWNLKWAKYRYQINRVQILNQIEREIGSRMKSRAAFVPVSGLLLHNDSDIDSRVVSKLQSRPQQAYNELHLVLQVCWHWQNTLQENTY